MLNYLINAWNTIENDDYSQLKNILLITSGIRVTPTILNKNHLFRDLLRIIKIITQ